MRPESDSGAGQVMLMLRGCVSEAVGAAFISGAASSTIPSQSRGMAWSVRNDGVKERKMMREDERA